MKPILLIDTNVRSDKEGLSSASFYSPLDNQENVHLHFLTNKEVLTAEEIIGIFE